MRFWIRFAFCALAVLLGVVLGGCAPGQGQTDEEKEPHFVLGQSRVNAMDYPGAIEAFEQSLEANPQSAAAHFELGWLYEEKVSDPAAAIYHYERYLKLNPNAGNADAHRGSALTPANNNWPPTCWGCRPRPPRSSNWKNSPGKTASCSSRWTSFRTP